MVPLPLTPHTYGAAWDSAYSALIQGFVDQSKQQCSPAARTMLLDGTAVCFVTMPIAAAEESSADVLHALLEYTHLKDSPPYIVLVSANWTTGRDMQAVARTVDTLNSYMQTYPDIGLAYYCVEYPPSITMAMLQKHNSDVAVKLSRSPLPKSAFQVSHGCDIMHLTPQYLRDIYDAYASPEAPTWVTAHTRHYVDERYPYLDSLVTWYDLRKRWQGGYELGMSVGTQAYIDSGGMDSSLTSQVWSSLCRRMFDGHTHGQQGQRYLEHAVAEISPRRFYYRLLEESAQLHNMWTGGAFEIVSHYRGYSPDRDITKRERDVLLSRFMADHGEAFYTLLSEYASQGSGEAAHDLKKLTQILRTISQTAGVVSIETEAAVLRGGGSENPNN